MFFMSSKLAGSVLLSWVGDSDLGGDDANPGPIARALAALPAFDEIVLLSDRAKGTPHALRRAPERRVTVDALEERLRKYTRAPVRVRHAPLASVLSYEEIYRHARAAATEAAADGAALTFHVSPGTPPMGAVWIILARTTFTAELIQSSPEEGVTSVKFPFELAAEFVPDLLARRDREIERRALAEPPPAPEFESIKHRSQQMKRAVALARRVALHSTPVLLTGESGTGKELFARAIHAASPRASKPYEPVNCAAIPAALFESELFGHVKGAFTDAKSDRIGRFERAHQGTIFLDEIGELGLEQQVKLLRVLEERKVTPVGGNEPRSIDVRVIAATNRHLPDEVQSGRFRVDLYYRLAIAIVRLPALRERQSDVGELIRVFLDEINLARRDADRPPLRLSAGAKNALLQHRWPGNVRELKATMARLEIWTESDVIEESDARDALAETVSSAAAENILGRPLGDGFDLKTLLKEVERHYVERAMLEAGGVKRTAANLLGWPSYQTVTGRLEGYEAERTKAAKKRR